MVELGLVFPGYRPRKSHTPNKPQSKLNMRWLGKEKAKGKI